MEFQAKAINFDNAVSVLAITAADEVDARRQLDERGLRVITLAPQ